MSIVDQPPPKSNAGPAIWDLVIADMQERHQIGIERYGTPLQAFNGRDSLVDAYQEILDLAVYLRAKIHEEESLASLKDAFDDVRVGRKQREAVDGCPCGGNCGC